MEFLPGVSIGVLPEDPLRISPAIPAGVLGDPLGVPLGALQGFL